MAHIKPIHPGAVLREDFLEPMGISAYRLAKDIAVPVNRISAIVNETRAISAETGLLLADIEASANPRLLYQLINV